MRFWRLAKKTGVQNGCDLHPFGSRLLWSILKGCLFIFTTEHPLVLPMKKVFLMDVKKVLGNWSPLGGDVDPMMDDRVSCLGCQHRVLEKSSIRMPADVLDKIRRVNDRGNRWVLESAVVANGWTTLDTSCHVCAAGQPSVIPPEIMHRCHLFVDVKDAPFVIKEEDDWWN